MVQCGWFYKTADDAGGNSLLFLNVLAICIKNDSGKNDEWRKCDAYTGK